MGGLLWETPGTDGVTSPLLQTATGQYAWKAAYSIEVAWGLEHTGFFVLDSSLLNGPDVLAPALFLVPAFDGAYDDLNRFGGAWPVHVTNAQWQRGRDETLASVEAGTASLTVTDKAGLLNPKNTASPLYGVTSRPGWFVRIRARVEPGPWQGQFLGFVRTLDYQPESRGGTATIEAEDLFLRLSRDKPVVIPPVTDATTGQGIGLVLDHLGWTDPAYRQLAAGDQIPLFETTAEDGLAGLDIVQALLSTEFGLAYVNGAGQVVFDDRLARARALSPAFTVSDSLRAIGPGTSLDRIVNTATFTRTGGTPQTYTDTVSADPIHGYGLNDAGTVDSAWLRDDDAAYQRAVYVVQAKKDPVGPIWGLQLDSREQGLLQVILGMDLNDLVSVSEAQTGTTGEFFVERVSRNVSFGPYTDTGEYVLSDRGPLAFLLDHSPLDGADLLAL